MEQVVLHFLGDFLFQNDWMAKNKNGFHYLGWLACFIHCLIYSLPFLFYLDIAGALLIFTAHFIIDKFRIAYYWTVFFKMNKKQFESRDHSFFLIFLVDITFHFSTNFLIFRFYG